MVLSPKQITKVLIRLPGCAGWSASLLFANVQRQGFFAPRASYVNKGHIIWMCSTSSNTQVIRNYSPQSGERRGLWFSVFSPVLTAHLPGWAWLQMANVHNWFRLYALVICDHGHPHPQSRGRSRTLILLL